MDPLRPGPSRRRWRILLLPFGLMALGVALVYLTPVPGLGLLLTIGASLAVLAIMLRIWLG